MLDNALALYELGFHVIPLGATGEQPPDYFINNRCDGNLDTALKRWPKSPRYRWKEFQTRTPTMEEIEHWWTLTPSANIAVITGLNVFVVDADSQAAIDWIEEKNITVTPWRVNTSKGRHYYYKFNPDLRQRNTVNVIKKIDTRGVGGYVVATGSVHQSMHIYQWDNLPGWDCETVNDLPMIKQEDLDKLHAFNTSPVPIGEAYFTADGEESFGNMALVHTSATMENVDEGQRNSAAASLAGQFLYKGFSLHETMSMLNDWNDGNKTPTSKQELQTTVASVANTATNNGQQVMISRPDHLPVPDVGDVVDPLTEQPIDPSTFSTVFEKRIEALNKRISAVGKLMASRPEIDNYWHSDVLYRGSRMMIGGDPKIGKSRFALAMAAAAAVGGRFLDWYFKKPLMVLWLQGEIDDYHNYQRVNMVRQGMSDEQLAHLDSNLMVSSEMELDLSSNDDCFVLDQSLKHIKPDLVIIDPLANFAAINENDAQEVMAFLKKMNRIKALNDCALVLVHHNKKRAMKSDPSIDDLRGSTAWRGWADSSIILAGTARKTSLIWDLRHNELNNGEIHWLADRGTYRFALEDPVIPPIQPNRQIVSEAL